MRYKLTLECIEDGDSYVVGSECDDVGLALTDIILGSQQQVCGWLKPLLHAVRANIEFQPPQEVPTAALNLHENIGLFLSKRQNIRRIQPPRAKP
jgi:hypothetical protein